MIHEPIWEGDAKVTFFCCFHMIIILVALLIKATIAYFEPGESKRVTQLEKEKGTCKNERWYELYNNYTILK